MATTVVTLTFSSAPASIANHRNYARIRGYRHIVIDASQSFSDPQGQWLYKYETLLDCLNQAAPDEIIMLLSENAIVVEPLKVEDLLGAQDALLVHIGQHMKQLDCQFWRSTEPVRALVLRIVMMCNYGQPVRKTELELFEGLPWTPFTQLFNGHVVVMPAGSTIAPLWTTNPCFLLVVGEPPFGPASDAPPMRVIGRFRDALVEHIASRQEKGVPRDTLAPAAVQDDSAYSVYNPGRPIGIVMLYTPNIALFARKSENNLRRYCERHDYTLHVYRNVPAHLDKRATGNWAKPFLLREHLPQHEWLFWIDSDVIVSDMRKPLEPFTQDRDIAFARDVAGYLLNSGVMGFRRTEGNAALLDEIGKTISVVPDKSGVFASMGDQEYFCRTIHRPHDAFSLFSINTIWQFARPDTFMIHYAGMKPWYKAMMMEYDEARALT
ncbi:galactosyl transferase GMA12/MNN10 domain protein [Caballeronia temeraria]|uniref:Galactosyl transferase GMA12/MNN10 domain protein n=1 Tax=Caballeronia temeraria TaxID=1777137 RepID=A0A157Z0S9_9BURK|nr:galactosyl transferase GMA12/MNN10 domain protein [Caballeronia temeraria]